MTLERCPSRIRLQRPPSASQMSEHVQFGQLQRGLHTALPARSFIRLLTRGTVGCEEGMGRDTASTSAPAKHRPDDAGAYPTLRFSLKCNLQVVQLPTSYRLAALLPGRTRRASFSASATSRCDPTLLRWPWLQYDRLPARISRAHPLHHCQARVRKRGHSGAMQLVHGVVCWWGAQQVDLYKS